VCDVFAGGAEFFDSLDRQRPACVLVDLHMPGMDGTEVLAHLSRQPDPISAMAVVP
jgi:CheY-like chemotaxis protein